MHRSGWMVAAALLMAGAAHASATFEIIGTGFASDISADGSVVVGSMPGSYETFRWTRQTGSVLLGMCSGCVLGRVAATARVSDDGNAISASIITPDSQYVTPGIWRSGSGWQALIPPVPSDGGLVDDAYGSGWIVSGDGLSVGGLYWRPGQPGGLAHAFRWTAAGGLVDLGSSGGDSRVHAANRDGSVMAGWDADPVDGHWRAAVWVNGVRKILSQSGAFTQADFVSTDGATVVGQDYDDVQHIGIAAMWKWNGSAWVRTVIGALPGTFSYYGGAHALGMSANGLTVVGYNTFDNQNRSGFIWSPETGMMDAAQFLADRDVTVPADFIIQFLEAVSADGRVIVGNGQDVFFPYNVRWFRIELSDPVGVGNPATAGLTLQAIPNPARHGTTVAFTLPRAGNVDLALFDVTGRRVCTLVSGDHPAGHDVARWDGRDLHGVPAGPGVYYLRLKTAERTETRRIVVVH